MKPASTILMAFIIAGCSAQPVVTETQTVYEHPPDALYPVCPHDPGPINTNGDLLRAYDDALAAIQCYKSGLEDLRAWPVEDETPAPAP